MNKCFGKIKDFVPVREEGTRVVVSYGKEKVNKTYAEWREVPLSKKQVPNVGLKEVKEAVINDINSRVKEAIVSGFVWNDKPVWLSVENQLNFSQSIAPVLLKIGEQEDGTPVTHEFATAEELKDFNTACAMWKQQCLQAGYHEKDGIDWSVYEALFPTAKNENNV